MIFSEVMPPSGDSLSGDALSGNVLCVDAPSGDVETCPPSTVKNYKNPTKVKNCIK